MASVRPRTWRTRDGETRRGYQVSWYDEGGKRHRELYSGDGAKKLAGDRKIDLEVAKRDGKSTASAPVLAGDIVATVRQGGERWVRYVECQLGRERSTWRAYERHLKNHIYPALIERADGTRVAFGDLAIATVTAPDCEALKDALLKRLTAKNARKVMTSVKMMFNDCVRRGAPPANPALAIKVLAAKRHEQPAKIPPKDELRRIIAAARTAPPAKPTLAEAWTLTTLFGGLRPSENRGAAIEDLVLEGKKPGIHVRRRADQWNVIGTVKSGSGRRFVPLPLEAIAVLRRWLLVVPRGPKETAGFKDPETGRRLHLLFPNSLGHVLPHSTVHNWLWVPVMIGADLVDWTPAHDKHGTPKRDSQGRPVLNPSPRYPVNVLRHLCASLKIEKGIDPKTLQQEMGHSSIQVTFDNYGHLFREREGDGAIVAGIARDLLA